MVWNSGQRDRHLQQGQDPLWVGWTGKAHRAGQRCRAEPGGRRTDQGEVTAWKSGMAKGQEAVLSAPGALCMQLLLVFSVISFLPQLQRSAVAPLSQWKKLSKGLREDRVPRALRHGAGRRDP